MLRWEKTRGGWGGYSGEKGIASFYRQGEGEYLWCANTPFGEGIYRKADTPEAAKAAAESAFRAWLDRAGLPSGDYQDGYRAGLEAAARLVEENSEAYAGSRKYLAPRIDGSLTGLGYAEAIRKLAAAPKPGEAP